MIVFDLDETLLTSIPRGELQPVVISSLLVCIEARDKLAKDPILPFPSVFGMDENNSSVFTLLTPTTKVDYNSFPFITIIRPYAIQLLCHLLKQGKFDIAVFSMGTAQYVYGCCDLLQALVRKHLKDETIQVFKMIKTREDSKYSSEFEMAYKDLTQFKGYDAMCILLVDNLAANFRVNTQQGIPIQSYSIEYIKQRECSSQDMQIDISLLRL